VLGGCPGQGACDAGIGENGLQFLIRHGKPRGPQPFFIDMPLKRAVGREIIARQRR
jgi:hypothetical protein